MLVLVQVIYVYKYIYFYFNEVKNIFFTINIGKNIGSWNEFKKPEKLLENAIAKMILNENKVNNETKKTVEKDVQSTNQHIKIDDDSVQDKNISFTTTITENKKTNENISEKSKNIKIEANQIDDEIVLKCLSDRLFII